MVRCEPVVREKLFVVKREITPEPAEEVVEAFAAPPDPLEADDLAPITIIPTKKKYVSQTT